MLESFRRLMGKGGKSGDLAGLQAWASTKGHDLRRSREGEGCVIEPSVPNPPWRLEYGAPQRNYITTRELRFIADVGTHKELAALVLNHELMEKMERAVFEQYVEDVQTRIDTETPPEMRWLVLYPKLGGTDLGKLRGRYAALGSVKPWVIQWLAGPLSDALLATIAATPPGAPTVLALARGRLVLRVESPAPTADTLAMWLAVFTNAATEARRLAREWTETPETSFSTMPTAFPPSAADES